MTWTETEHQLTKEFVFANFEEAMAWMNKAAVIIEQHNHHPTWTNTYNTIHISLTTHDAGNKVTDKDRNLALALDELT